MNSRTEFALALLRKAEDDAYAASRLAADPAVSDWVIGFHAQQAVEKAIKAVLSHRGVEYPRTHNIAMLTELLRRSENPLPPQADQLVNLIPYGTALRYDVVDDDSGVAVPLDRTAAGGQVEATIAWASQVLGRL